MVKLQGLSNIHVGALHASVNVSESRQPSRVSPLTNVATVVTAPRLIAATRQMPWSVSLLLVFGEMLGTNTSAVTVEVDSAGSGAPLTATVERVSYT